MSSEWERDIGPTGDFRQDVEIGSYLSVLDPASGDPNYWMRFRVWVLRSAAGELARRRIMSDLTVSEVLASWARAVVPTAVLAAAIAGVVLARTHSVPDPARLTVEEILTDGIEGETIPVALGLGEGAVVTLASQEGF